MFAAAAAAVFVAYSHVDARPAATLERRLSSSGCIVLSDRRIRPGDDWTLAVERMIDRADIVAVLLRSPASLHVRAEYQRALRRGKRVIPVVADPRADIPLPLEPLVRLSLPEVTRSFPCRSSQY